MEEQSQQTSEVERLQAIIKDLEKKYYDLKKKHDDLIDTTYTQIDKMNGEMDKMVSDEEWQKVNEENYQQSIKLRDLTVKLNEALNERDHRGRQIDDLNEKLRRFESDEELQKEPNKRRRITKSEKVLVMI